MTQSFEELGLQPNLLQAIVKSEYTDPTPIQAQAIPLLLQGHDVLGQAQTGTGKTAAFTLPLLQQIDTERNDIQALVLTPTRELASQVANSVFKYGEFGSTRVLAIYGGVSYDRQLRRLEKGPHIVVGTPGRLLDLINRKALDLSTVQYVVLDEADEMLKMGFIEDVQSILREIPKEQRQTALFSATMSAEVRMLAEQYMRNPVSITIAREKLTVPQTEQRYYMVHKDSKLAALSRLLETEDIQSALVFTRTRSGSVEVADELLKRGYVADALHGELNQAARESVLRRFRNGQLPILVATDVVARGVDISGVSHVFNFDMPYDPEDYVHRIGRTGRAGRSGTALMLVTPQERRRIAGLESYTGQRITKSEFPTTETVYEQRDRRFAGKLENVLNGEDLQGEREMVSGLIEGGYDLAEITAALIHLARADEQNRPVEDLKSVREDYRPRRDDASRDRSYNRTGGRSRTTGGESGMVRLVIDQGKNSGIRPGDIVGAVAAESGIPGKAIGAIDIQTDRTYFDVKASHVDQVLSSMRRWRMRGKQIKLMRADRV
jgi:ATP-dependent RNA helicase DeaD